MKCYGNLWEQVTTFENLMQSSRQAQRGKRFRKNVLAFNYHLESELLQLQAELTDKTYQPGSYRVFEITDPKPRLIAAAPYRDRIVHHALCNVIVPLMERGFIHDSYANRLGYGTHRALRRFVKFARSSRYILQCDIRKYFPSIDHQVLKAIIRRKIKCGETLRLIDKIIDSGNIEVLASQFYDLPPQPDRPKGLPIGNLTSQFFANVYLNGFDHFVKETLKISKYLRYVDDFALFSDDWGELSQAQQAIKAYLETLHLELHPIKTQLFETRFGANFVGFRVLCDRIRVRNDNLRRSRRRLRGLGKAYAAGKVLLPKLLQRLGSWEAHLKHGDTYRLRCKIFENWPMVGQPQGLG
ncbi:MAG: RNA-dependent DNA polymerase [Chloroflexaceae bacterium]|nr:RNA-dependent DNA polymerase [Chloroflexaceae bacterium]